MSTNVLFLTEAGAGIGFGHLSRSVALADGFDFLGCDITFIVRGAKQALIHGRTFVEINDEWFHEEFLNSVVQHYDIVVTDSYKASERTLNMISQSSKNPVFLIDSQLKYGDKGTLLFPSVYAKEYTFNTDRYKKVLAGITYLLFTKEMWGNLLFNVRNDVRRIGISLGSSQPKSVGVILDCLNKTFPELEQINVFGDLKFRYSTDDKIKIKRMGRLTKDYYLMKLLNLDFLISNGGQTLNEALLIGLPVLPLVTADNQLKSVKGWERRGIVKGLDWSRKPDQDKLLNRVESLYPFNARKAFNLKCEQNIEYTGSIKAAKEILELM